MLFALLLVIHTGQTADNKNTLSRVHMLQAVNNLQGCLTCHTETPFGIDQRVLSYGYHPAMQALDRTVLTTVIPLKSQIDHQLFDVGQRILDTQFTDSHSSTRAVQKFLRIYDQAQANPDSEYVLLSVIQQLGGLEQLLRVLENQASPYQLKKVNISAVQNTVVAVQIASSAPLALVSEPVTMLDPALYYSSRCDDCRMNRPAQVSFAAYRRGPPTVIAGESVLFGKKIAMFVDAQSSFLLF